jgi:hypothetical protein
MSTLFTTSNYLVPAIVLNPILMLHGINTFASHFIPSAMAAPAIMSPNKWALPLGPPTTIDPYLDMHANDLLCWSYTMIMVILNILAFGRINDNRERRSAAKAAAKAECERLRRIERLTEGVTMESETTSTGVNHAGYEKEYELALKGDKKGCLGHMLTNVPSSASDTTNESRESDLDTLSASDEEIAV